MTALLAACLAAPPSRLLLFHSLTRSLPKRDRDDAGTVDDRQPQKKERERSDKGDGPGEKTGEARWAFHVDTFLNRV